MTLRPHVPFKGGVLTRMRKEIVESRVLWWVIYAYVLWGIRRALPTIVTNRADGWHQPERWRPM